MMFLAVSRFFHDLLDMELWPTYPPSLGLSFCICKMWVELLMGGARSFVHTVEALGLRAAICAVGVG